MKFYQYMSFSSNIEIQAYKSSDAWKILDNYLDTFPKFLREDREKGDFYYAKFYIAFQGKRPVAICAITDKAKNVPNPWIWIAASTRGTKYHVKGAFSKLLDHVLDIYPYLNGRYLDDNARQFWKHISEKKSYKFKEITWPWKAKGFMISK